MIILFLLFAWTVGVESHELGSLDDRCEFTVDPGPCQQYQMKWFWDKEDESCKEFHYGGCMGNRNRFNTKHECMKQCRYKMFNPISVPDLCLMEPDQGHCGDERQGQWWYHFNSESGECEKFFYYGCGGNDNKFYSLHMCRKVCAERLSPQIACDQCDLRTSFCKSHSKMNYTCECRIGYEKNQYGECVDIDECRGYTAACDKNAWCSNTIGGYECECMAAYRGDGKTCTYVGLGRSTMDCVDCSEHASCEGGICQCKKGFQGDGFNCTDVNECLRTPEVCDRNAECVNREGSFVCQCLKGFAGNGYNCTTSKNSCLDKFDRGYQETCGGENWREHYYMDHETKRCTLFWYDGCKGRSRNVFSSLETCETMCEETNVLTRAEICWDKFDLGYKNQCLNGQWEQRFYFDHASLTCRQFWFDGCRSDSRNMFEDALTCQWLCEAQPMYKSRSCLEDFDVALKGECNGGRWRRQFYFDYKNKICVPFWYDGCKGKNENIFQDEASCKQTCEDPTKKDPKKPWHNNDRHAMKEKLGEVFKPNMTNICETSRPCRNNGTCVFNWKKNSHYCKCAPGWTGDACKQKLDFDPCSTQPCHNGGSCKAKTEKGKSSIECYCTNGWSGDTCDERPCESNPCLNNGTCRTTRGHTSYFCDCAPSYGGKHCDIAIGSTAPETFGKNVEQVSSGKLEWIEEMKRRLAEKERLEEKAKKKAAEKSAEKAAQEADEKAAKPAADEPYKNSAEEREVQRAKIKKNPGSREQSEKKEQSSSSGEKRAAERDSSACSSTAPLLLLLLLLLH